MAITLVWGRKVFVLLHLLFLTIVFVACLPITPIPVPPTLTATPTGTPTPTIIWFPPTPTRTPIPTVHPSATPDLRSGIGNIIFQDDFQDSTHWLTGNMGQGTLTVGSDGISLAITQPTGYLFSTRDEPVLGDFYAEITASPNICTGIDEYGMLVRYNSLVDFYRFSLSCNGQTRLDKLVGGIATSPQPWLRSSSVPSAAPSSSRIGVWAYGSEMHFFINDEFQFSVNDRILSSGTIGVFARAAGEIAVTVSFSDLVVYQIQQ